MGRGAARRGPCFVLRLSGFLLPHRLLERPAINRMVVLGAAAVAAQVRTVAGV